MAPVAGVGTRRRRPRLAAAGGAVLVVALLVTGCAKAQWDTSDIDDPTTTTQKEYSRDEAGLIESITDRFSTEARNLNVWAAPRDQAQCAAEKIVRGIGVDRLLDLGFDPQEGQLALAFSDDEHDAVLNILVGCIDVGHAVAEMFSAYQKLSVPASQCLGASIERRGLARDLVSGLLAGTEPDPSAEGNRLGAGITDAMAECLDPTKDLVPVIPADPFPEADLGPATTLPAEDDAEAPEGD